MEEREERSLAALRAAPTAKAAQRTEKTEKDEAPPLPDFWPELTADARAHLAVDPLKQPREIRFVGRADDEDTRALRGRKPPIVEIVAIERDERALQLPREGEVPPVGRAAQIVVLDHVEDVPVQALAHESDDAGRHVGVGVDAGPVGQPGVCGQLFG